MSKHIYTRNRFFVQNIYGNVKFGTFSITLSEKREPERELKEVKLVKVAHESSDIDI